MKIQLTKPGLFITATDTDIGKTVTTCAIAVTLRRAGLKVGVCKPIATGCRLEREQLYNSDAEALAHFADCQVPLHVINPVRYHPPLAPAVAAEKADKPIDYQSISLALEYLDQHHDIILIEAIGGLMVPLDQKLTLADLARDIGYPLVVVTRPNLGTLNHTAMTCRLIRQASIPLAGIVINNYNPDDPDPSIADNPRWLSLQNDKPVLASIPHADNVAPEKASLPQSIVDAVATTDWKSIAKKPLL